MDSDSIKEGRQVTQTSTGKTANVPVEEVPGDQNSGLHEVIMKVVDGDTEVGNEFAAAGLVGHLSYSSTFAFTLELDRRGLIVTRKTDVRGKNASELIEEETKATEKFIDYMMTSGKFPRDAAIKIIRLGIDGGIRFGIR